MRYKSLISDKLERITNLLIALKSMTSKPTTTHQELDGMFNHIEERIEEVKVLINSEIES
jgi:hypothetical protein